MKSLLQEGSSIEKAISVAWETAGKPKEFTIKILDAGTKNFLGFCKTPAIVSIMFEPATAPTSRVFNQGSQNNQRNHSDKNNAQVAGKKVVGQKAVLKHVASESIKAHEPKLRQLPTGQAQKSELKTESAPAVVREVTQPEGWTEQTVGDITTFLQEVLNIMGSDVCFTTLFEKQILTITFARPIVADPEAERMLYASLSYLFVQFLKKKHKKRFKGFRLMFVAQ